MKFWGNAMGDSFLLVSLIRKTMNGITVMYIATLIYCLHAKKLVLIDILQQGDLIEREFARLGIQIPCTLSQSRLLGQVMALAFFFFCIVHRILNVLKYDYKINWYEEPAQGLLRMVSINFLLFPQNLIDRDSSYSLYQIVGLLGVILETITFNIWYFGEMFLMCLSLIMWQAFTCIQNAFKEEVEFNPLKAKRGLTQLMELHFQTTRLMDLINELLSPVVLLSHVFTIFYLGYWLNYTILEHTFRPHHFALFVFVMKTSFTMILQADLHHKAHDISEWLLRRNLELDNYYLRQNWTDGITGENGDLPALDSSKLILFISHLYGRHDIGFKGYFFFTVSPSFITKASIFNIFTSLSNPYTIL